MGNEPDVLPLWKAANYIMTFVAMTRDRVTIKKQVSGLIPRTLLVGALAAGSMLLTAPAEASDYAPDSHPQVAAMIDQLAQNQGLDADALTATMEHAQRSQKVLDAMSHPAEHHLRWDQYRRIFLTPQRVNQGVEFIREHLDDFTRAEREYGVPREVIAAILGVETTYGRNKGSIRVIDALSTLAFDYPPRHEFFRKQLEAYLTLTQQQHLDPLAMQGSYAGAFGYAQFIPTSYQAYAVDFNHNGKRDLNGEASDAIGSIANYFSRHGWIKGLAVTLPVKGPATPPDDLPVNSVDSPAVNRQQLEQNGFTPLVPLNPNDRLTPIALDYADGHYDWWLGTQNFYVITRYNHSHLYAMAVTELAEEIKEALNNQ